MLRGLIALALLLSPVSCLNLPLAPGANSSRERSFTGEDLDEDLALWADTFSSLVSASADRIRDETRDRTIRRRSLLWKVRLIPLANQAAYLSDAQAAYVAVLTLGIAQRLYLTEGDGAALFGDLQPEAVEVARYLESDALEIGRNFLSPEELDRLQGQLAELVLRSPIRGEFAPHALVRGASSARTQRSLAWIVDLPMVPFHAFSGVSEAAASIREFTEVAESFVGTLNDLPQQTRWQLELLLYDLEDRETVIGLLAALQSVADSTHDLSQLAHEMPSDTAAAIGVSLEDARATIADAEAALSRAQDLSIPLTHIADRLAETSDQWATLFARTESDRTKDTGRPFDIREYETTASEIARAAQEIRAGIRELQNVGERSQLEPTLGGIARMLTEAEDHGRSLIDRAVLGSILVIVVFFALLVTTRLVTARRVS